MERGARRIASPQPGTRMMSPQRMTRVLLLATVLGACEQSYCHYRDVDHYFGGYWMPFIHGAGAAPEQYRIGVKMVAWWLVQHLSWQFRYGFTLMDVIASVAGALLVYDLLLRRPAIWESSTAFPMVCLSGVCTAGLLLHVVGRVILPAGDAAEFRTYGVHGVALDAGAG